ncbi:MAG: ABC transporter ATP-binding protein [Lachnospiraceae bacterium]|nr:ABC transporter ATP-binding protein [Lachnospiraceae bacterium]
MEILRTENLCKTYGKNENEVQAVKNVSISVEKGEFVAIVGSSGSGKSTLMHMLGGVDRPTSGKVFVENEDIYALSDDKLAVFRRRQVGLIYQFYNLIPVLNVEENITLPCELDGRRVEAEMLNEMIENMGLDKVRDHLPNELSGGQQQRVAIGRALITRPAILLADEPTGNLDTKNGNEIMELLKASNRKLKQTIIMITHNLELAKQADRIIRMEDGVAYDGNASMDQNKQGTGDEASGDFSCGSHEK